MLYTRRDFLGVAGVLGLGGAMAVSGGWSLALAGTSGKFSDQLFNVFDTPDTMAVTQLTTTALENPALAALASDTLQSGIPLSRFEQSMLEALLLATENADVLSALELSTRGHTDTPNLSKEQFKALNELKKSFAKNFAFRQLLHVGEDLKRSDQLPNIVNEFIAKIGAPLPSPTGDPLFDSILQDIGAIQESTPFLNLQSNLIPLMQSPDFIVWLRAQSSILVSSFIPSDAFQSLLDGNVTRIRSVSTIGSLRTWFNIVRSYLWRIVVAVWTPIHEWFVRHFTLHFHIGIQLSGSVDYNP